MSFRRSGLLLQGGARCALPQSYGPAGRVRHALSARRRVPRRDALSLAACGLHPGRAHPAQRAGHASCSADVTDTPRHPALDVDAVVQGACGAPFLFAPYFSAPRTEPTRAWVCTHQCSHAASWLAAHSRGSPARAAASPCLASRAGWPTWPRWSSSRPRSPHALAPSGSPSMRTSRSLPPAACLPRST